MQMPDWDAAGAYGIRSVQLSRHGRTGFECSAIGIPSPRLHSRRQDVAEQVPHVRAHAYMRSMQPALAILHAAHAYIDSMQPALAISHVRRGPSDGARGLGEMSLVLPLPSTAGAAVRMSCSRSRGSPGWFLHDAESEISRRET